MKETQYLYVVLLNDPTETEIYTTATNYGDAAAKVENFIEQKGWTLKPIEIRLLATQDENFII